MYRHLFLEGSVQAGKSTLLRKLIEPNISLVGGFTSQRLIDAQGNTIAFRIGPAGSTTLTAPYTDEAIQKLDGIFRFNAADGTALKFPEVFDNEGVKHLSRTGGKKIMLLDEIGGAELLNSGFREALYNLLKSDIPCIGVIKLEERAEFMSRTAGYKKNVVHYNRELRQRITDEFNGRILTFRRDDETTKTEIKEFLCGIFMTK